MTSNAQKNFIWHGIDAKGFRAKGELLAQNTQAAKATLSQQKITVLKLTRKLEIHWFSAKNNIKHTDITEFSIEFSTLISAGIPLSTALHIMTESTKKTVMKNMLTSIKKQIENGRLLSESLQSQGDHFDDFFCNLIHVGEYSGTLDRMLQHIATHREKIATLKKKIKKALFYPGVVLAVALIITCAMLIIVMPQFAHLFQSVGAELPVLTQRVIQSAEFMRQQGGLLCGVGIVGFFLLKMTVRHYQSCRYFLDRFWLKWPLIGNMLSDAIFARCLHTLATTLQAGLPVLEALQLTANMASNSLYTQGFHTVCQQIKNGQTLHKALQNTQLFPSRVIQMVSIGEESGRLDEMLQKLADFFAERLDDKVENLSQLLEPALMIFLCVLVGTLVVAMYLPIFRLSAVL